MSCFSASRVFLILLLIVGTCFSPRAYGVALDTYSHLELSPISASSAGLHVTFLGVATILFDDGETAIMTDGFFTRPNLISVATKKISPNREIIAKSLEHAGVKRLAAVLVTHSHYDHAMDSPEVAMRTGAVVVGSESTANIARGWGLPEDRIISVKNDQNLKFGRFEVTFVRSEHAPTNLAKGEITKRLVPPVRAIEYRDGGSYAILIKHDGKTILVQSSAGIASGALHGKKADVVFLGVGLLGKQRASYRDQYWNEVVREVGAHRVIPIHWDDFSRSLDEPLVPIPWPFDDLKKALTFLSERGSAEGVDVKLAPSWKAIDPFDGLP